MIGLAVRLALTFARVVSTVVTGSMLVMVLGALPWWAVVTAVVVWVLVLRRLKRGRAAAGVEADPNGAQFSPTRSVGF